MLALPRQTQVYALRRPWHELRRLRGRHELECPPFGRCRWLARLRRGYVAAVFCLHGVAAREQLSAVGDVSGLDREVFAIDVQEGVAIGQQVLRPIAHQTLSGADMDPPLRIGRNPDRVARRPTGPTTKCR